MYMKQKLWIFYVILTMFAFCGCSGQKAAPTPMESVTAAPAMASTSLHPAAQTAQDVLSSYQALMDKTAEEAPASISHTIPEDMFALLARYADHMNVTPQNGRYTFTAVEESTHAYQASGMEMEMGTTPDPSDETPMDDTRMGDYSVQGGGQYKRTMLFDVAEDLSQGRIEITNLLNGENTGHEIYTFARRSDGFYFADAAADLSVTLDILQSSGTYLVAIGRLSESKVEVAEYHVASLDLLPSPDNMDFDSLKNTQELLSYLCTDKDTTTFR